jgi:hypothetical protein
MTLPMRRNRKPFGAGEERDAAKAILVVARRNGFPNYPDVHKDKFQLIQSQHRV